MKNPTIRQIEDEYNEKIAHAHGEIAGIKDYIKFMRDSKAIAIRNVIRTENTILRRLKEFDKKRRRSISTSPTN